jgi:BASS family bile acid:Na+ symporter
MIRVTFSLSIALIVFALGLRCRPSEATCLLRERGLLLRTVLAMNVIQPIVAGLLVWLAHLHPATEIALVALAVSPVPPMLPGKQLKLVTQESHVYGQLLAISVLAIALVPLTMALLGTFTGRSVYVRPATVARIVGTSVLAPLALGMLARRLKPTAATRVSCVASSIGNWLLTAAALMVLVAAAPTIIALLGNGTLLVCMAFAVVGLAVGHWLGGPNEDDRTVLALATATRHPGVAVAVGTAAYPDQKLVAAAVVLYVLVSAVASAPYTAWRRRLHARSMAATSDGKPHHMEQR